MNNISYIRKWQSENPERIKEYRDRRKEKQAIYYAKWYKSHGRKRSENYGDIVILWKNKNPEKLKAINMVNNAIKGGTLNRPDKCLICGNKKKVIGHHENYDLSLVVLWVCHSCHKKIHLQKKDLTSL